MFFATVDFDLYFIEWDKTQAQKRRLIPQVLVGAALNLKSSIETMSSSFRTETLKQLETWIPFFRLLMFPQLRRVRFFLCLLSFKMIAPSVQR